ncbi:hypothetical protein R69746_08190 [Paraburkholderia aspalathi]|uniref:hypothetical protein n=1 Tax=Paraburkholderia aspalathi TaxID=1324617 RepID=UPI00190C29C1|nr:hypothetical protein [Paraburkholderia aspalathi]MBK3844128.1 hypothetical protein [Paraburkholderia aspalathi]CAE6867492.1 hypothetical protein R69746_08190 [Paraburkholderia aspalathi]
MTTRLIDGKPWVPFNLVDPCDDGDVISLVHNVRYMHRGESDAVLECRAALLKMISSGRCETLGLRLTGRLS